jgi:serine/threonine-protein kinase
MAIEDRAEARAQRVLAKRYRLQERIDEGGAGEVWRARDERLDRDVAVKVLGRGADEAFRTRFAEESRRAAAVIHPNVVTVFDEGRDGPDAFMVMELVPGKTLRDIIAERGPLPPHEVSRLVTQVAAALDAAHAAGVIHCDVKPANVMIDPSGTAKLTDFGIARAATSQDEQELLGTARYIAPERLEGRPVTPRTDVYGLGLLAYELLAGQPAFDGTSNTELVRKRLLGPPPSLRHRRLGLSAHVDDVLARSLAVDPERRHESAGAFARALAGATEATGDATSFLGAASVGHRARRWSLPRFDSTVALLAVLVVLLATVLFFASFPKALPAVAPPAASPTVANATAPNLVGKKLADAIDALLKAGFNAAWDVAPGASGAPCTVARQDPAPGAAITAKQRVALYYVAGKDCTRKGD